jgi:very-short-patch-repair endonuclease
MPDHVRSASPIGTRIAAARADEAIGALAARQHGVIARRQLLAAGVTTKAIHVRHRAGRLLRVHVGVYAVGHVQLRREGWCLAAVLAAGPGAALSHRDAAALLGLLPPGSHRRTEVTTTRRFASTERIRVYGPRSLAAEDVTTRDGIPTTAIARTLVDLASVLTADRLAKALGEADRLRLLDVPTVERTLARTSGRHGPGHSTMREALRQLEAHGPTLTHSELEDRFLSLVVRTHGLPRPSMNAYVAGFKVDALWPIERLVVELDGWAFHHHRAAFQGDRTRDARLATAGYAVLRFTYADVMERPAWMAQTIGAMLASPPRATMSRPPCP